MIRLDIEDMFAATGTPKPPNCLLMLQDMRTVHGSQFKGVDLIVGSSPCQDFSYRAMPWTRARTLTGPFLGLKLFHEQFRIQREASEAAGRHIPMVVENVRGAIPWVGRSRYNFGSYHLWGDVPALMPSPSRSSGTKAPGLGAGRVHPDDPRHTRGLDFTRLAGQNAEGRKNGDVGGGSWFNIGSPGQTTVGGNPDGRKVPGFRFDGSGRSFQTASVEAHVAEGRKHHGDWFRDPSTPTRQGGARLVTVAEGRKGAGAGAGAEWFDQNLCVKSSRSPARKAASAKIAKIPLVLSRWIGRCYLPRDAPYV